MGNEEPERPDWTLALRRRETVPLPFQCGKRVRRSFRRGTSLDLLLITRALSASGVRSAARSTSSAPWAQLIVGELAVLRRARAMRRSWPSSRSWGSPVTSGRWSGWWATMPLSPSARHGCRLPPRRGAEPVEVTLRDGSRVSCARCCARTASGGGGNEPLLESRATSASILRRGFVRALGSALRCRLRESLRLGGVRGLRSPTSARRASCGCIRPERGRDGGRRRRRVPRHGHGQHPSSVAGGGALEMGITHFSARS